MSVLYLQFESSDRAGRAAKLGKSGAHIVVSEPRWPQFFELAKKEKPYAIAIDFSQAPSHCLETADYIAKAKETRETPSLPSAGSRGPARSGEEAASERAHRHGAGARAHLDRGGAEGAGTGAREEGSGRRRAQDRAREEARPRRAARIRQDGKAAGESRGGRSREEEGLPAPPEEEDPAAPAKNRPRRRRAPPAPPRRSKPRGPAPDGDVGSFVRPRPAAPAPGARRALLFVAVWGLVVMGWATFARDVLPRRAPRGLASRNRRPRAAARPLRRRLVSQDRARRVRPERALPRDAVGARLLPPLSGARRRRLAPLERGSVRRGHGGLARGAGDRVDPLRRGGNAAARRDLRDPRARLPPPLPDGVLPRVLPMPSPSSCCSPSSRSTRSAGAPGRRPRSSGSWRD